MAMKQGETIFRSPLEKPLGQLTEEDISQVTREDCRRYLKDKGMRRPSWNKSQAIEQVISLKSLLETQPESENTDDFRQKITVSRPPDCNNPPPLPPPSLSSNPDPITEKVRTTNADFQVSVSTDESVLHLRKDLSKPGFSGDLLCHPLVSDEKTTPPRNVQSTNVRASQMTIFYCGKVNVYDDIPTNKARVIMQLAASPMHLLQETRSVGTLAVQPVQCQLQAGSARPDPTSVAVNLNVRNAVAEASWQYAEGTVSRDCETEGPASRKASVQRYLEKRKDRGRFKIKKKEGGSSSNLEMYLNNQIRNQPPNEQSSHNETCSPPQPRPPNTPSRCYSSERSPNIIDLSVDLNTNNLEDA